MRLKEDYHSRMRLRRRMKSIGIQNKLLFYAFIERHPNFMRLNSFSLINYAFRSSEVCAYRKKEPFQSCSMRLQGNHTIL